MVSTGRHLRRIPPSRLQQDEQVLLTITTTHAPATDLGYLLHKHPAGALAFDVSVGTAHVFYPEATETRCTAALLLEVDPIGLVRGRRGAPREGFALGQYVNDRPYAASSMLSVALSRVYKTALAGRCESRPELAATPIPLEIRVPALPSRGDPTLAARLFEPLGWRTGMTPVPLDATFPDWGDSPYVDLTLTGELRLADALSHLYVLLPVLDDAKHYWITEDEVDKLLRAGGDWLRTHPEQPLIIDRYLKHQGNLGRSALARLAEVDDAAPVQLEDDSAEVGDTDVTQAPVLGSVRDDTVAQPGDSRPVPLAEQRRVAVHAALRAAGARKVADLGCGEGALVATLLADPSFTEIIAVDVSTRVLETAARRLHLDQATDRQRERLRLFQSALTYRDDRLSGLDAAVLMEVIEHVDPPRLPALERNLFGAAAPTTVVVTTPNAEHNVRFPALAAGAFRHRDHRFEWSRQEFAEWAGRICETYGYAVQLLPVGPDDPEVGPPSQLAVFSRRAVSAVAAVAS